MSGAGLPGAREAGRPRLRACAPVCIFLLLLLPFPAAARSLTADPSSYREQLKNLRPGDVLTLASGQYTQGLPIHGLGGASGAPIIVQGADHAPRPVFLGREGHNTVSIVDSRHVVIRNLILDGRNLPVDGVKAEGHARFAHHITLENLRIVNHGRNQQIVGISTKCPAWGWIIRDNEIIGAGTGIYLGDSDGSAPFVSGLIEHNLVRDTPGYNLQIKHQHARPALPGMPAGRRATVIRHNVLSKARNSSIGPMARPNLLLGHFPRIGPGSEDLYLVYGNFFYQNPDEALFQGEGNLYIYNNLLVNTFHDGLIIQPHNDAPKQVMIFANTILALNMGIFIRDADPLFTQAALGNAVFAAQPLVGVDQTQNITASFADAVLYLNNPLAQPGDLDLFPQPGRLLLDDPVDPMVKEDFNGSPSDGRFAGAYSGEGKNPGWLPRLERKPRK